jgi:hypothetical protein
MRVESRSIVYDAAAEEESGRVAFFDGVLQVASGTWLCGFTSGKTKHHHEGTIRLCRSGDGAVSWELLPWRFETRLDQAPGSLAGAELVEVDRGKLLLFTTWFDRTDPERPLFDPQTEGILRSRQLVAESRDEGRSWSTWRVVPTPGLTGTAITGPVLKWADGTIGFAIESFKEYDDPRPAKHGAWLVISRDGGRTFEPPHLIAADPQQQVYYWDQRLCVGREPGEYVGLFWTHDRGEKRDRRVHFVRGNIHEGSHETAAALAQKAFKTGKTIRELWRESKQRQPTETTIPGQIAAPLLLADGRLLAFVVDRQRPGTLRLWVSRDGGQTWPEAESLVVHEHDEQARLSQGLENIDFAQYWEDMAKWSFGHPAIRPYDGQRVLVTYYAGPPGCLSIHSAIVRVD